VRETVRERDGGREGGSERETERGRERERGWGGGSRCVFFFIFVDKLTFYIGVIR
jgi:hypothetical protein